MIDRSQKVYLARCIGPDGVPMPAYKIGCSYGWNERIKQVGLNLPFTLEIEALVPGGSVMETVYHLVLRDHCISGEYFHASERVCSVVEAAAASGNAFYYITDNGGDIPNGALQAFMDYHGISLKEVCEFLGFPLSQYEKRIAKPFFKPKKLIAAVAILASRRGQFATWPNDAMKHLLGQVHPQLEKQEVAA